MNSNSFLRISIAILALTFLAAGCKNKRKLQKVEQAAADTTSKCKLDFKTARGLSRHMRDNEFKFDWVLAKANVESNFDDKEESFDIRLSARKDSAMLITIQYLLGLQVAKVLITRDSVKFVNYVQKTYFKGEISYINDLLNAELDFELVQAILFGNAAEFYDEEARLKPVIDRERCLYLLSTERRRRLKRIQSGGQDIRNALQILTLRPDYKIIRNEYIDPATTRSFIATYSSFDTKDSVFAPYHVDIDISAQKKATLKIDYVRIETNKPQRLSLNIPAKYDAIRIEK